MFQMPFYLYPGVEQRPWRANAAPEYEPNLGIAGRQPVTVKATERPATTITTDTERGVPGPWGSTAVTVMASR